MLVFLHIPEKTKEQAWPAGKPRSRLHHPRLMRAVCSVPRTQGAWAQRPRPFFRMGRKHGATSEAAEKEARYSGHTSNASEDGQLRKANFVIGLFSYQHYQHYMVLMICMLCVMVCVILVTHALESKLGVVVKWDSVNSYLRWMWMQDVLFWFNFSYLLFYFQLYECFRLQT